MGFGISLKVGFLVYLVGCSHLLDTLGRRKCLIYGLILHILLQTTLLALPSHPLLPAYLLLCLFSVAFHLVYYAGWLYMLELTPPSHHSLAIVLANCGKSTTLLVGSLMFSMVTQKTWLVMLGNVAMAGALLGVMLVVP
jgi:MFS family permease